tara:strand:- start:266 stop:502 length:237 start_codon:yes stop_codon:yes gene_type:complete
MSNDFKTGDLVHIPAEVYRFKKPDLQLDFFSTIGKTKQPMVGLFREYVDNKQCLVSLHDGEWIIPLRNIYQIKEKQYA